MCGRFSQYNLGTAFEALFNIEIKDYFHPRYNISPSSLVPVVIQDHKDSKFKIEVMYWGLIPNWIHQKSFIGFSNTRSETVLEKPSFKDSFKKRRCLVPVNGYFEWKTIKKEKSPYYFSPIKNDFFLLAGIYDINTRLIESPIKSFSLMTITPNDLAINVHDRMPVIINYNYIIDWLSDLDGDSQFHTQFIKSYPSNEMQVYPVSKKVSSGKYDGPDCIQKVKSDFMFLFE